VGVAQDGPVLQGRSEFEEFSFYAEESAQFAGEEICADCQKEGRSNLLFLNFLSTGLHGNTVLTGSRDFAVKEIEVFEVTDAKSEKSREPPF
jgi:hypothetical protein